MSRRWWALAALTAGLWLAMAAVAPPGLPDARVLGYDSAALIDWARDGQAVAQARRVMWMDLVVPALLVVVLVWPLRPGALWLPALAYGALDYAENATLARFYEGLMAGLPPAPSAGTLTLAKWVAVALAVAILSLAPARYRRKRSRS